MNDDTGTFPPAAAPTVFHKLPRNLIPPCTTSGPRYSSVWVIIPDKAFSNPPPPLILVLGLDLVRMCDGEEE